MLLTHTHIIDSMRSTLMLCERSLLMSLFDPHFMNISSCKLDSAGMLAVIRFTESLSRRDSNPFLIDGRSKKRGDNSSGEKYTKANAV